jgi:hypothetical protein
MVICATAMGTTAVSGIIMATDITTIVTGAITATTTLPPTTAAAVAITITASSGGKEFARFIGHAPAADGEPGFCLPRKRKQPQHYMLYGT